MDYSKNHSIKHIKDYVDLIDFSAIHQKLVSYYHWSERDVAKTSQMYRNFLFLTCKYRKENPYLPPSEDIDEFWHQHILDTKKYIHDCNYVFGEYLHHYPYFGIDSNSTMSDLYSAFDVTQRLYYKEFGEYIIPTHSARSRIVSSFVNGMRRIYQLPFLCFLKQS